MKKINIKDIYLDIDMQYILSVKASENSIYIDIEGKIFHNIEDIKDKAIIFKNDSLNKFVLINDIKVLSNELFKLYKPEVIGTSCRIKPLNNWQNIIDLNKDNMLYFDHQSDGVEIFEDKDLEDYGWHASALEVDYRTISEFIEDNCEGTLLCYDNEIQFNGFVIVNSIEDTRSKVRSFIVEKTKVNIEDSIIELDDEDVVEALEFFEIEV